MMALWMGTASSTDTSVCGMVAAQAHTAAATNRNPVLTTPDCNGRRNQRALRSETALNSQPINAMSASTYIHTSRMMAAAMEPYMRL